MRVTNGLIDIRPQLGIKSNLIDLKTASIVSQFKNINDMLIQATAVTNNGQTVVAYRDSVIVYDVNGAITNEINIWKPECMAIHPMDDNLLAVGDEDGYITIVKLNTGTKVMGWKAHDGHISTIVFNHANGTRLMSCSPRTHKIQVWDPINGSPIGNSYGYDILTDPCISYDGTQLAFANEVPESSISIINVNSGTNVVPVIKPPIGGRLTKLVFEPTGSEVVAMYSSVATLGCRVIGSSQNDVIRWSLVNGTQVGRTFEGIATWGIHEFIAPCSNDLMVATNSYSSVILIWNRTTARLERFLKLLPESLADFTAMSPDGRYLILQTQLFDVEPLGEHKQEFNNPKSESYASNENTPLFYSTNLNEVSNSVITSMNDPAPVCCGISEYNIADGIAVGMKGTSLARYSIPDTLSLFFGITPSHKTKTKVVVDPIDKKIKVTLPLLLDVYHSDERSQTHRVSRTEMTFSISAEPSMITKRADIAQFLQLDFSEAGLTSTVETFIIDPTRITDEFGTNEKFLVLVEQTVNSLIAASGEGIGLYLKSIVMNAPLPDSWNRSREYELIFRRFEYEMVSVRADTLAENVGYLFVTFSLVSHNFPPPCICREDESMLVSKFNDVNDLKRRISLAFSEVALNVLATPHRLSGDRSHKSWGGMLYGSVDTFFKTQIGIIIINRTEIIGPVSIENAGSISGGLRDPVLKKNIVKETIGFSAAFRNVFTRWRFSVLSDYTEKGITSMVLKPSVLILPDNVDIDLETPLPREVNQVLSWFVDWFMSILLTLISFAIVRIGHIELLFDVFNNRDHDFAILNAESELFNRSSVVITAEINVCVE